jgi:hypothetical protein
MNLPVGKFVVLSALCLLLEGCAQTGPPLPPSLELPRPPSDLRANRKGNSVTLTWSQPTLTTDRRSVRYLGKTLVCRGLAASLSQCGTPVGQAPPLDLTTKDAAGRIPATYTDTLPSDLQQGNPTGFAIYSVEVLNRDGSSAGLANQVRVPLVPTWPPFENFAAQVTAQGVRISWSWPSPPARASNFRCLFRIYRRLEDATTANKIADIALDACGGPASLVPLSPDAMTQSASQATEPATNKPDSNVFLDQTFEWEKTYFYRGTVVSVVADSDKHEVEVEGDDTPEVKVFAHDVFPPAVPAGLQAVYSGENQKPFVDLIWAPVTDADLAGYNIYRREGNGAAVKVNSDLVKSPSYRDSAVATGNTYVYSVSAVDLRGNESQQSEEASEEVP